MSFVSDMSPKRSKSKERERKRKKRAEMSSEDKMLEQEKARIRMMKRRQNMNDIDKEVFKVKSRKGMQKLRKSKESRRNEPVLNPLWPTGLLYGETPQYKRDRELQKQKTQQRRQNQTIQEKNKEKEERNERMRKLREKQTAEDKKVENEKKKERMRKLRERRKEEKCINDSEDSRCSDIVNKLRTVTEVTSDHEECVCDIDINCKYCEEVYENEKNLVQTISPEEKERFDKEDLEQYKIMQRNERKLRRKMIKEKLLKPLPPLPERELSQYEKIRLEIISQRNKEWLQVEKEWEEKVGKK